MKPFIKVMSTCLLVLAIGVVVAVARGAGTPSRANGRLVRVAADGPTTTSAPTDSTLPVDPIAGLPDCIPVGNMNGQVVGCALKSQLYPADATPDNPAMPPNGMPGFPVYDRPGGTIVGYEVGSDGFIAGSVADNPDEFAHLSGCMTKLLSGDLDGSPDLPGCVDALKLQGFADPVKDAHQIAVSRQKDAPPVP